MVLSLSFTFVFLYANADLVGILLEWAGHLQYLLASTGKIPRSQAARSHLPSVLLGYVAWY